jgi:hypothetical protein
MRATNRLPVLIPASIAQLAERRYSVSKAAGSIPASGHNLMDVRNLMDD